MLKHHDYKSHLTHAIMHNSLADNFLLEEDLAETSLIIHKN